MSLAQVDLIGTWRLVEYLILSKDGKKISYPYGENAQGFITYMENGMVSVHVMRKDRSLPVQSGNFREGDDASKLERAENYAGYCGRYEVSKTASQVTHKLFISSFLPLMTYDQIRDVLFSEGRLILSCPDAMEEGAVARLTWERFINKE